MIDTIFTLCVGIKTAALLSGGERRRNGGKGFTAPTLGWKFPMSANIASTTRKLEDLPSDGGRAVDTLAGAMLRLFVRLHALEETQARLGRRLAALEGAVPSTAVAPAEKGSGMSASLPATLPKRGRGRPPGSPNKRLRNGHDENDDAAP